jgi:hypothetical protein
MKTCMYCGKGGRITRGMCSGHYHRWLRTGNATARQRRVKGQGTISKHLGYRIIWVNDRQVYEHRHVMECHLGRPLKPTEIVHHLDHNKLNNRLENLEVVDRATHCRVSHPKSPEEFRAMQALGVIARNAKRTID